MEDESNESNNMIELFFFCPYRTFNIYNIISQVGFSSNWSMWFASREILISTPIDSTKKMQIEIMNEPNKKNPFWRGLSTRCLNNSSIPYFDQ